jgi:regulator of replication initiation timing
MSSADGLQKLTEYLNQTRRQAEAAIDVLNKRIFELQESNDELKLEADRLRSEVELIIYAVILYMNYLNLIRISRGITFSD